MGTQEKNSHLFDPELWREKASCRDLDTAIFFADTPDGLETAKSICRGCPVRKECFDFALRTRQNYGVWGGENFDDAKRLRRNAATKARRDRLKAQKKNNS